MPAAPRPLTGREVGGVPVDIPSTLSLATRNWPIPLGRETLPSSPLEPRGLVVPGIGTSSSDSETSRPQLTRAPVMALALGPERPRARAASILMLSANPSISASLGIGPEVPGTLGGSFPCSKGGSTKTSCLSLLLLPPLEARALPGIAPPLPLPPPPLSTPDIELVAGLLLRDVARPCRLLLLPLLISIPADFFAVLRLEMVGFAECAEVWPPPPPAAPPPIPETPANPLDADGAVGGSRRGPGGVE